MSRADILANSDVQVRHFVLNGEVTDAEVDAGVAAGSKWMSLAKVLRLFSARQVVSDRAPTVSDAAAVGTVWLQYETP